MCLNSRARGGWGGGVKTETLSVFFFVAYSEGQIKADRACRVQQLPRDGVSMRGIPAPGLPSLHVNTLADCSGLSR